MDDQPAVPFPNSNPNQPNTNPPGQANVYSSPVGQTPASTNAPLVTTDTDVAPPPPMAGNPTPPPPPVQSMTPPPPMNTTSSTPPDAGNVSETPAAKKNNLSMILVITGIVSLIGILIFLGIKFIPSLLSGNSPVGNKQVTLTWWGLWEDQSVVTPIINEYQASHPNVKINYIKQSQQDYRERLTNAIAKGNGPDIFRFHNSWLPMFKNDLDAVPKTVMPIDDFEKNYYPVMANDLELGSSFYGMPMDYDGLALYVNEDIFSTNGKTVPKDWFELRETAKSLTIKDDKGTIQQAGVALGRTENVDHWQEILALMMLQNGVKLENPQGKNAEDALSFFTVFSSVDGVWDETLPNSTIAFSSGKLAMYIGPSWRYFEIKEQNPNLKFKVYPVPQLPKADPSDKDITYASYWVEGVWKRSANKEAAWEFMKYLSSKETLQKLYSSASKTRTFGELYPRTDMASLLSSDPVASIFMASAPTAQSWYLQSRTFDGNTGINSQINKYFEDAVNAMNSSNNRVTDLLKTVASGVNQVLSNYGFSQATTTQAK